VETPGPDVARLTIQRGRRSVRALVELVFWRGLGLALVLGFLVAVYLEAGFQGLVKPPFEVSTAPTLVEETVLAPVDSRAIMSPVVGYVIARRRAAVGVSRPGKLVELRIEEGSRVEEGMLLGKLDDALPRAELARAHAQIETQRSELASVEAQIKTAETEVARADEQLAFARSERERQEKLSEKELGRGSELDQARTREKTAKVELDQARARVEVATAAVQQVKARIAASEADEKVAAESLEQCLVRSPFRGIVIQKLAEVGETLGAPGTSSDKGSSFGPSAIAIVADMSVPEVEADVPESRVGELSSREAAEIELDALPGKIFRGELRIVLPTADRRKATVPVRVKMFDPPDVIRPDMSARVTFVSTPAAELETPRAPVRVTRRVEVPPGPLSRRTFYGLGVAALRERVEPYVSSWLVRLGGLVLVVVAGAWYLRGPKTTPPPPRPAPAPAPPKKPSKKASFRMARANSVSDVESADEIIVVDEQDEATVVEDAVPMGERCVHALGRDGRIGEDVWLLRAHRVDRRRAVLPIEGSEITVELEPGDTVGVRLVPSGGEVAIEGVAVPAAGADLVHGMVFTVGATPYLYLEREPNTSERRRVYARPREDEDEQKARASARMLPGSNEDPIVSVRGLEKIYMRGSNVVKVLNGLDLEIARGDFIALMGPSGSGKTTLLNIVAGIDRATAGSVVVDGREITQLTEAELASWRAKNVGFIFQFYNLIPVLTAQENVELPLLLTDLGGRERREHARHALELVGLADRAHHRPRELSGGQEQRVAIARAIATDPAIIVADEPTGDLDIESANAVLDLMVKLNEELKKTIIMVTHDPRAADRARNVHRLEKGVLRA
jgi:putative ABC transport system ATP-binding protein